jgi:general secretion pathway protein A
VFTSSAVKKLFQLSGGIPRLLNLICDRALLGGYSQQKALIDAGLVNQAASEVLAIKPQQDKAAWPVWLWPVFTLVALGVGAGLSALIW